MLDVDFIRQNREVVQSALSSKNIKLDLSRFFELDTNRRGLIGKVEALREERNILSRELSDVSLNSESKASKATRAKAIKEELKSLEESLQLADSEFIKLYKQIPNIPTDDTPIGKTEDDNQVVFKWGEVRAFDFEPKNHWQIAEKKDWIDKTRAAKVTGSRFAYLKGDIALLSRALMNFGIDVLTNQAVISEIISQNNLSVSDKPFSLVLPPLMIKTESYDAMDRLEPRDDRYKIEGEDLWLQGSAEHVLGSMHAGDVFEKADLPVRYVGLATSFRREAGTYGKDMEGILRMHQFDKLEMESFSDEDSSLDEHFFMIAIQEYLMQQLELPYQKVFKCTADIGKPNARGVDLDVWLPGQNKYRETHTADYMTDYQSRRLKTKYRNPDGSQKLVHTNDATAFSQRPLIAIIENFQTKEGDVVIPSKLVKYMNGKEKI